MHDGLEVPPKTDTLIVCVGASAGGLEAFRDLFARLSDNEHLALVLVQHLDPDHRSVVQELLSKRTSTPVQTAEDGMKVLPGNIYLIPPGASMSIANGKLMLEEFTSPRGQRRPIDTFLKSLAEDAGPNSIAIILSGTGSDGSMGVKAVKEAGGLVIVQDPSEAAYDGMPRNAIASGAVDLTLTIEDMAEVLRDYKSRRNGIEPFIDNEHEFVGRVFKHVRFHTGQDFTQYKLSTLMRRLTLRMAALGQISPADYLERLIQDRGEAFKLQQDVLINVTRFFRDEDAFKTLQKDIIPQILNDRGRDETVRIWVPGCSTGEEAYTIGMLVAEGVAQSSNEPDVTIFGTDIDEDALQMARQGHYPNHIVEHIPEDLLQRYFAPTADGFNVGKKLRSLVRFSNQSLIKDPPFSKLDLISCRNVLIYFEKALQEHALNIFHYALKPDGFLFLGTSENPQATHSGFMEVSATDHIYRRDQNPSQPLNLPLGPFGGDRLPATLSNDRERTMKRSVDAVRDAILERHGLPFIVTSSTGLVSHISPGAEKFIKLRSGDMQTEIGRIIHPALESIIRRLNNQNTEKEGEVTGAQFSGEIEGEMMTLEVTSERVHSGERFFVFHPSDSPIPQIDRRVEASTGEESAYVRELEQELDDARQTVRTTVEELETSNEELKSSNEEMMSMNEELQSSNEELSTMNDELQSKILETQELNSDLRGFIASTGLATVFLDTSFCVRRFTPEAKTYFRFAENDIGRSVEDIASTLPVSKIIDLCKEVVSSEQVREINISAKDKSIQLIVRAALSKDLENERIGIVFTLIDITQIRKNEAELKRSKSSALRSLREVEELYRSSPAAMALYDPDLRYIRVNQKLADINNIPIKDHIGKKIEDIVPQLGDAVIAPVRQVFETGKPILDQEVVGYTAALPDQERVWIVDWYPLSMGEEIVAVGVNVRDITEYKNIQIELQRIMRELQHRVKNMLANVTSLINRAKRDERDPETVLSTLFDRIQALGKTHQLLASENWRSTNIREIIEPELTDVYGHDAITIQGPEIQCNSRATLALGMAIHELATNAAKYGALSTKEGHLHVSWVKIDEGNGEIFRLEWKESNCPISKAPENQGFGSTLIRSTISRTLAGDVDINWEQDGLQCVFNVPIERINKIDDDVSTHLF